MNPKTLFQWRYFQPEIILLRVKLLVFYAGNISIIFTFFLQQTTSKIYKPIVFH
ncbi:MAG: hypothetical protein CLLPBCKN_006608 [Chroococcidiopsis cubana SAG 39.79]|nr:hypothetical protein [Chroococcidiopsis cubana SAG 39.79]